MCCFIMIGFLLSLNVNDRMIEVTSQRGNPNEKSSIHENKHANSLFCTLGLDVMH